MYVYISAAVQAALILCVLKIEGMTEKGARGRREK